MNSNKNNLTEERIKKILLADKIKSYNGFSKMLKSDLEKILLQYMDIKKIEIEIETTDINNYLLKIDVEAKNISTPTII